LERSRIPVTTAFSHQAHLPRLARLSAAAARPAAQGGAAATAAAAASSPTCLPCHRQVVEASEPGDVAAPTAETCASAGCHDGRATFGVTERCTMCHQDPPATFFAVPRPTARFLHRQHGEAQAKGGCTSCHRLRPGSGGVLEPANHQACTSCHGPDFGASAPTTCGACHTSTEPWRALRADRLPAPDTELGARMDHGKHDLPCQRCHTLDTATRQLRLPRDHSTCTGASCHQHAGAPAPLLSECQACHVAELVATRRAARQRAPWSVRRRFDHGQHKLDLEGRPAACTSCHLAVAGPLESMPTPPKRTCEPCHDGGRAFGLTGTGCARCHGASR
ncbi:MAG TPA: cytochrome c3 family protein, partial [Kofleriaceae bacterium]|nr:cytochrome c3 family protein [Kofleriaceae bacterium]